MRRVVLLCVTVLALGSCALPNDLGGSSTETESASAVPDSARPTSSSPVSDEVNAAAVAEAMSARVATMKVTVVFTEETDPNKLLGQPGGYTSKVAFADSRIDPAEVHAFSLGSVERGGSIEVFADPAQAKQRSDYIRSTTEGRLVGAEHHFLAEGILVRVIARLSTTQAADYDTALKAVAPS